METGRMVEKEGMAFRDFKTGVKKELLPKIRITERKQDHIPQLKEEEGDDNDTYLPGNQMRTCFSWACLYKEMQNILTRKVIPPP